MRVVAGSAKGRRLAPVPPGTRPLSDRAREGLFSSLGEAIRALRSNLDRTELSDMAKVVKGDVLRFLGGSRPSPSDLVFLDPPWATPPEMLDSLAEGLAAGWLSPGWTVVLHRPTKGYMPVIPVNWRVAKRLVYGDTLLALYREV